jgi:hypothetical protein
VDAAVGEGDERQHERGPGQDPEARPPPAPLEAKQHPQRDDEVDEDQQEQGRIHPDAGNPPEAEDQAPRDAPGGVHCRREPDPTSRLLRAPGVDPDQNRERRSEQRGGEQHDRQDQREQQVDGVAAWRGERKPRVGEREIRDRGHAERDRGRDRDVQQPEGPWQIADAVDPARHHQAPRPDAQQVGGKDRGEAVERALHDDAEDLGPDDLVADRDEAGDREEREETPGVLGARRRLAVGRRQGRGRGAASRRHPARDHDRAAEPQPRNQPEAAQVGAEDGSERVRPVQDGADAAQCGVFGHEPAGDDRKRRAHGGGGWQQDRGGRRQADSAQNPCRGVGTDPRGEVVELLQKRQREQGEGADSQLQQGVGAERVSNPREQPRCE